MYLACSLAGGSVSGPVSFYCYSQLLTWGFAATEDYRTSGPLLPQQEWNKALLRTGFDGLHVALADDVEETHVTSLLVSRVPSLMEHSQDLPTVILVQTPRQKELAEVLQLPLNAQSKWKCAVVFVDSFAQDLSAYPRCISLLELDNTIFSNLTGTHFAVIQHMLRFCKPILWISTKCGRRPDSPEAAMVSGFAKTVTRENPGQSFISLNLNTAHDTAEVLLRVMDEIRSVPTILAETDLLEEGGVVYIPRLVEAPNINHLQDTTVVNNQS